MADDIRVSLRRLFEVALHDTGQSRRVADFLLAWQDGNENGGWNPADLWALDQELAIDLTYCVLFIREHHGAYPGDLGFKKQIELVWKLWREPVAEARDAT
jgi:hypothetical protein